MKKTGLFAFLTAAAIMVTASGCGSKKSAGEVAIEVGNHKITMADVSVTIQGYTSGYGADFEKAKEMAVKDVEEAFEYEALANKMGIELDDEDKDNIIMQKASLIRSTGLKYSEYVEYLEKSGSNMNFLEEYVTASVYKNKVTEKLSSEENKESASVEEMGEFLKDGYYRAKHILIAEPAEGETPTESTAVTEEDGKTGEELANLVLEKAKNGEDFDAMIEKYNTDPGMSQNPDGYVFTDGAMVKEFEDCVKGLQPGEFGIAKTSYGYHVIQRLSLDGSEENFNKWVEDNKSALEFKALCKKNGITSKVNQDAIDSFTEDQMVKPEPAV